MTDHEYKAGFMSVIGGKACKVCGKGRGEHWKPFLLDTLTPSEVAALIEKAELDARNKAYDPRGFHEEQR
jgi:hypothetical protein